MLAVNPGTAAEQHLCELIIENWNIRASKDLDCQGNSREWRLSKFQNYSCLQGGLPQAQPHLSRALPCTIFSLFSGPLSLLFPLPKTLSSLLPRHGKSPSRSHIRYRVLQEAFPDPLNSESSALAHLLSPIRAFIFHSSYPSVCFPLEL